MLVLFSVLPVSATINIVGDGVTTRYGSNITEHSNMTFLNFTANES